MINRCHVIDVSERTHRQPFHLSLFRAGIEEHMQLSGHCPAMITSEADCKVSRQRLGQIAGAWPSGHKALSRLRVVIAWGSLSGTPPFWSTLHVVIAWGSTSGTPPFWSTLNFVITWGSFFFTQHRLQCQSALCLMMV